MSTPIAYQPATPPARPQWWPGAIAVALVLVLAACVAWEHATPALGERSLSAVKIWTARCTAASLWMAGQAMLLGVALPAIYRPKPIYSVLTALVAFAAVLTGITAGALWFAS